TYPENRCCEQTTFEEPSSLAISAFAVALLLEPPWPPTGTTHPRHPDSAKYLCGEAWRLAQPRTTGSSAPKAAALKTSISPHVNTTTDRILPVLA
ncbi:hypothetical protein DFH07DRAFT_938606, partial [Mycena maculata]